VKVPLLVIGGGLSGLAAAVRAARFVPDILIIEKHSRPGGLNSYFYRNKTLYETGLHAITNYAPAREKNAPLNRLLRQLKLKRKDFSFCQQLQSEVIFSDSESLLFSNDFNLIKEQINSKFPRCIDNFHKLLDSINSTDPFLPAPFSSAKKKINEILGDRLLTDMLLCPLMFYGSSHENDMDLNQFIIMFQAIYIQGMFRPSGTIKNFLDHLLHHYQSFGGTVKMSTEAVKLVHKNNTIYGVELANGEIIECDQVVSTIGLDETRKLLSEKVDHLQPRLGFTETIYEVKAGGDSSLPRDKTIIFYNNSDQFSYERPEDFVDHSSGVICFPGNFQGIEKREVVEIRATHLANFTKWKNLSSNRDEYRALKKITSRKTVTNIEKIVGSFKANIVYENSFTPVTIERYTGKIDGAIYGSPVKVKDGNIGFTNLFLAGTDQGFLGIVGSMLSGVSIVNRHVLAKL